MNEVKRKDKDIYQEIIRCVAMLMVIGVHVVGSISNKAPDSAVYAWFIKLLEEFNNIGVPIFFCLSGYYLLRSNSDNIIDWYKRRFKRILIPFFLYAVIYIVYFTGIEQKNFAGIPLEYIKGVLGNNVHPTHWFVYTICALYLITPFLTRMFNNMTDDEVGILLIIGVAYNIIYGLLSLFGVQFGIPEMFFLAGEGFYYISGYCFFRLKDRSKIQSILKYRWIIISIMFLMSLFCKDVSTFRRFIPLLLVQSPAKPIEINKATRWLISLSSKLSYQVYLIHAAMISVVLKLYSNWADYFIPKTISLYFVVWLVSMIFVIVCNIPLFLCLNRSDK